VVADGMTSGWRREPWPHVLPPQTNKNGSRCVCKTKPLSPSRSRTLTPAHFPFAQSIVHQGFASSVSKERDILRTNPTNLHHADELMTQES
jgi:hypothetical protein